MVFLSFAGVFVIFLVVPASLLLGFAKCFLRCGFWVQYDVRGDVWGVLWYSDDSLILISEWIAALSEVHVMKSCCFHLDHRP